MNAINRLIDMHGVKALEADVETQDLILRNNLIWTAHGILRCLTAAERERLLGFPVCVSSVCHSFHHRDACSSLHHLMQGLHVWVHDECAIKHAGGKFPC